MATGSTVTFFHSLNKCKGILTRKIITEENGDTSIEQIKNDTLRHQNVTRLGSRMTLSEDFCCISVFQKTMLHAPPKQKLCTIRTVAFWRVQESSCPSNYILATGPSRATAGPEETFSQGPQTFSRAPLGRKFLNFSFQNDTFWHTLYFWPTAGPPKCRALPSRRAWLAMIQFTMSYCQLSACGQKSAPESRTSWALRSRRTSTCDSRRWSDSYDACKTEHGHGKRHHMCTRTPPASDWGWSESAHLRSWSVDASDAPRNRKHHQCCHRLMQRRTSFLELYTARKHTNKL